MSRDIYESTPEPMAGRNPWWKRSGFGQMVLYAVSVAAWRIFDGVPIGSEEVITFATMALLLLGYQARKPSGPVTP